MDQVLMVTNISQETWRSYGNIGVVAKESEYTPCRSYKHCTLTLPLGICHIGLWASLEWLYVPRTYQGTKKPMLFKTKKVTTWIESQISRQVTYLDKNESVYIFPGYRNILVTKYWNTMAYSTFWKVLLTWEIKIQRYWLGHFISRKDQQKRNYTLSSAYSNSPMLS